MAGANPFDQFDAPSGTVGANPFDQFDAGDRTADEAMASPAGKQLEKELRAKADKMLLEQAGGGASSPAFTGVMSAANTALFNVPRNVGAAVRTLKTGRPFTQEYGYLKDVEEASGRQNPFAEALGIGAGVVGGALAVPMAPAAALLGRAAQGAALGAGYGGLSEFADTKDIGRAATAALGGAALGGIAPPLVEGLTRGAGVVGRAAAAPFRGAVNPEAEAARRVGGAIQRDVAAGGGQLDEAALAAAQRQGQPAVVADIGGETTRALARSAANTSPEARAALERVTSDRFEGQAPRVSEFVMGLGSGNEAIATREALQEAARKANDPAYKTAYAEGDKGIFTPEMERLTGSPDVLAAMKAAARTGKSRAINDGYGAFNPGVTVTDDGRVIFHAGRQGVPTYPNLQYWDYVKQELDDAASAAARAGRKGEASRIGAQARMLRSELDDVVPSYQEARMGAAKFFGAQDALEAGEKFVTARGKNSEFASAIAKMSSPERKLFADGFASRLSQQMNETGDRRSILNSIFQSPAARERVSMALGPDKAKEFEAFLHVESLMDDLRKALGNSTTARQLTELGLAGGLGGAASYLSGEGVTPGIFLGMLARRGKSRIDANVARRVGEMLASDNPATFKKALKMVKKSPRILNFVKAADTRLGVLLSGGAEGAGRRIIDVTRGVAPGVVPSRADQENKGDIPTIRR